jgi:glutathione synthase/RimK-type ligase-like ATP-grasp enzyme
MRIALFLKIDYAGFDIALTESGLKIFEFNLYFGTKGVRLNTAALGYEINLYLQRQMNEINFIPEVVHFQIFDPA